jgi:RHS repeat-associated protein
VRTLSQRFLTALLGALVALQAGAIAPASSLAAASGVMPVGAETPREAALREPTKVPALPAATSVTCDDFERPNQTGLGTGPLGTWQAWSPSGIANIVDGEASLIRANDGGPGTFRYLDLGSISLPFEIIIKHRVWLAPTQYDDTTPISVFFGLATAPAFGTSPPDDYYLARYYHIGRLDNPGRWLDSYPRALVGNQTGWTTSLGVREFDPNYADGTAFYTKLEVFSGDKVLIKDWYATDPEPATFFEVPITNPSTAPMRYLVLENVSQYEVIPPLDPQGEWRIDDVCLDRDPTPPLVAESIPPGTDHNRYPNGETGGDPVDTFTGSFEYTHQDVAILGRGPVIDFQRTYNSDDPRVGPLGPGWTHNYASSLVLADDSSGDLYLIGPQGRSDRYVLNPDGSYTAPGGIHTRLVLNPDGTYTATAQDQSTWTFDSGGRLTTLRDRYGNASTLAYAAGKLASISDPAGRGSLTLSYTNNLLTSVTDWASPSRSVTYQYDANGRLWKATDREGKTTTFAYDGTSQRLTTLTDARAHVALTLTYDAQGRVQTQKDARGLTTGDATTFGYVVNGDGTRVTTVTSPPTSFEPAFNPTLVDTYSAQGWITQRTSHPSTTETLIESYSYDVAGNRASITNPRGNTTNFCYDVDYGGVAITGSKGNLTRVIGPPPISGANRPVTLNAYDVKNNLIQTVSPKGVSSGTTVTCATNLSAINASYATDLAYDVSLTMLLSRTARYTDPDLGALTAVTKYEYGDAANPGLVTKVIPPRGNTGPTPDYTYATTFGYFGTGSKAGLLSSVTDALGNLTTYDYDAVGRRISSVDPLGNAAGGVPADHRTDYVYDNEDRVRFVKLPAPVAGGSQLVSETRYDEVGNPIVQINANGQVTTRTYDERDALSQLKESPNPWSDPASPPSGVITTAYTYDTAGNLTRMTRAQGDATYERATDYTYDGRSLVRRETQYPSWPSTSGSLVATTTYDPSGNKATYVDQLSRTTTFGYDALERQTSIDYSDPGTPDVSLSYDANGDRTQMVDGTGTSTYAYDELNRMTSVTSPGPKTIGYRYDRDGNRTKLIYPDATAVTYTFNKASQLSSLLDWASHSVSYTYWPDGLVKTATNPDTSVSTYTYDNARRLIDLLQQRTTTTITHQAYQLDRDGNVAAVTDFVSGLTPAPAWAVQAAINDVLTNDQVRPAIAIGADGWVYAAWADARSGDNDIYFSRRDPATGAWTASVRVNNVTTGSQAQPALTVDTTGNVYVVWSDARLGATDDDIYFSKRSATTGTWSTSVRVNDDGTGKHQNDPSIAISGTGEAIAAWYDERGGGSKKYVYSARLPAGGSTWSANLKVSSDSSAVKAEPEVAIGADGTTYAVWRDHRNGNADIWFATLTLGGSVWSTNTKISDDPGTASQDAPDIGVDTAGNLLAVWNDARVTPSQIRARRRAAGGSTWSASVVLGGSTSNAPGIQVRPDGRAYAAWFNGTPGTLTTIWGSEYDPVAGTWAAAERLTDPAEEGANPAVAFTTTQLIVAYQRRPSGGNYDIYSRRKSLGGDESFYGYDRLYRLTSVAGPDGPRSYTYDPAGNRLTKVTGGSTAYTYDRADRITAAGALSVTVDANGNTTARGTDAFGYDQASHMTTATVAGSSETYVYDGDGTRFSRQIGGNPAIRYVTDANMALPVIIDDGTRKYVYGLGLAFDVAGSSLEIYHTDPLGSVRALTNSSGTVTAGYRSDEYGITAATSGASAQPFGFTGEPRDATGLTYLRTRFYDSTLGRLISRDRFVGNPRACQSLNRYAYAVNNPTTMVDPSGLKGRALIEPPDPCSSVGVGGRLLRVGLGAYLFAWGAGLVVIGGVVVAAPVLAEAEAGPEAWWLIPETIEGFGYGGLTIALGGLPTAAAGVKIALSC